jgi:hypothetical protein
VRKSDKIKEDLCSLEDIAFLVPVLLERSRVYVLRENFLALRDSEGDFKSFHPAAATLPSQMLRVYW